MTSHKILNVATPINATDAGTKGYVDAHSATGKLNKTGDTMSGPLAMGANKVTGVANGTAAQDAATVSQASNFVNAPGNRSFSDYIYTPTFPQSPDDFVVFYNSTQAKWNAKAANGSIVRSNSNASIVLNYLSTTYATTGYISVVVLGPMTLPWQVNWKPPHSRIDFRGAVTAPYGFLNLSGAHADLRFATVTSASTTRDILILNATSQYILGGDMHGGRNSVTLHGSQGSEIHLKNLDGQAYAGIYITQAQFDQIFFNSIYGGTVGICVDPSVHGYGAGENKFYFGVIGGGGMDWGIIQGSQNVWMGGNQFTGTIFACDQIGVWYQSGGDHAYTLFKGVVDCIGGSGTPTDIYDLGRDNIWILTYARSGKTTYAASSYVISVEENKAGFAQ